MQDFKVYQINNEPVLHLNPNLDFFEGFNPDKDGRKLAELILKDNLELSKSDLAAYVTKIRKKYSGEILPMIKFIRWWESDKSTMLDPINFAMVLKEGIPPANTYSDAYYWHDDGYWNMETACKLEIKVINNVFGKRFSQQKVNFINPLTDKTLMLVLKDEFGEPIYIGIMFDDADLPNLTINATYKKPVTFSIAQLTRFDGLEMNEFKLKLRKNNESFWQAA